MPRPEKCKTLSQLFSLFRDLINGPVRKDAKDGEEFSDFVKRVLKLNKPQDWNFICSAMDLLDDTTGAISHFLRFGLDGATRYDELGEKYLRLYGVLNSTYIQQEAVYVICKGCQLLNQRCFREKIESLDIRDARHRLGAHSVDYMEKESNEILSFVPIQMSLGGYHCEYINNNDLSGGEINLKAALYQHLDLMIDIMISVIEKMNKTLYKTNKEKMDQVSEHLSALITERNGGVIMWNEGKPSIVIHPFKAE